MRLQHLDEVKDATHAVKRASGKASAIRQELNAIPDRIADLREELATARATAEVEGRDEDDDERVQDLRDAIQAERSKQQALEDDLAAAEKVIEMREQEKTKAIASALDRVRKEARPKVAEAIEDALSAWNALLEANETLRELETDYRTLDEDANRGGRRHERVLPTGPGYYTLPLDIPETVKKWAQGLEAAKVHLAADGTPSQSPYAGNHGHDGAVEDVPSAAQTSA